MNSIDKSRRRFLKSAGLLSAAGLLGVSCSRTDSSNSDSAENEHGMTYRINPNTGDKVSLLGFGCMRLPTIGMISGDEDDTRIDQETVNRQVDYALEHGVNYFDTSPAYCKGQSEAAMGIALSRHPRESYFIATKLSNFAPQTWPYEESVKMFENSLKYLQTDYIDYLLLHSVGDFDAYYGRYRDNGMLDYLKARRSDGTIRNLGFSYHGDIRVFDYLLEMMDRGEIHWDFVQIQLNYVDWYRAKDVNTRNTDAEYLYNELEKRGIPAVIMEPLLGGRLANVPASIAAKMKERRPDDSPAKWAFRFAGTPEGILTVLSGMTYMEHLRENVDTYSPLVPVDEAENDFLLSMANDLLRGDAIECTACNYCMPCPYGVNIPAVFAHYNKCLNEDKMVTDNRDSRYAKARRAYLADLDRRIPAERRADRCIACGECLEHCPQGIDIPAHMARIEDYTDRLRHNEI